MCKTILDEIAGNAILIPIPNSNITDASHSEFKTLELAKLIAGCSEGRLSAVPALIFERSQQKSRDGGPRSPYHFEGSYRIAHDVSGQIVLIDDVVTSGGHIIGACWKLKSHKRMIVLACTFGSTTKEQLNDPISRRSQMLSLEKPAMLFGDGDF
jgi:phosphoribosylpyrophosphate synthetase